MYYIIVDEDEIIILTDTIHGNQVICKTVEYSIDSMNCGFVLADNKIIFEAGEVADIGELDTLFQDAYTIEIRTEDEE
jgi:hypothetical protein